jgi:hypothetical protein
MLPTQWSNEGLGILSRGFEIPNFWAFRSLGDIVLPAATLPRATRRGGKRQGH